MFSRRVKPSVTVINLKHSLQQRCYETVRFHVKSLEAVRVLEQQRQREASASSDDGGEEFVCYQIYSVGADDSNQTLGDILFASFRGHPMLYFAPRHQAFVQRFPWVPNNEESLTGFLAQVCGVHAAELTRAGPPPRMPRIPNRLFRPKHTCSICHEVGFANALLCGHVLHIECLKQWHANNNASDDLTCPFCRAPSSFEITNYDSRDG